MWNLTYSYENSLWKTIPVVWYVLSSLLTAASSDVFVWGAGVQSGAELWGWKEALMQWVA